MHNFEMYCVLPLLCLIYVVVVVKSVVIDDNQAKALRLMQQSMKMNSREVLGRIFTSSKIHGYAIAGNISARRQNIENFIDGLALNKHVDIIDAEYIPPYESLSQYVDRGYLHPGYNEKGVHQKLNRGRLACQLSLIKTLKKFLASKHATAVIFEDDVMPAAVFSFAEAGNLLAQMLSVSRFSWDIQYPGFCFACDVPLSNAGENKWIVRGYIPLCAHAIVFNRRAAKVFVDLWAPLLQPGDMRLAEVICQTGLKVLRPALPIFDQNRSLSVSGTGNKDKPLVPFRTPGLCYKHSMQCTEKYSPSLAKKYNVIGGPIRVPIKNGLSPRD